MVFPKYFAYAQNYLELKIFLFESQARIEITEIKNERSSFKLCLGKDN